MRVAVGSYTGNGTSQDVTTGFDPVVVLSTEANVGTAGHGGIKLSTMTGSNGVAVQTVNPPLSANVCTLGTGKFTVGSSGIMNTNAVVYHWLALGGDGNTQVQTGNYTGSLGADNRTITTAFQPDFVWVIAIGDTGVNYIWHQSRGGDSTIVINTTFGGVVADRIQSVTATSFVVGTSLNQNGVSYYWFILKRKTGKIAQENYAGNSTDGHVITMTDPFQPLAVMASRRGASQGALKYSSMAGNNGLNFAANSICGTKTDSVKTLTSTGFTLGTSNSVNQTGQTYDFFAFADDIPGVALPTAPVSLPAGFSQSGVSTLPFSGYGRYKNVRQAVQIFNDLSLAP